MNSIQAQLHSFIQDLYPLSEDCISASTDLIEEAILDSVGIFQLQHFISNTFDISLTAAHFQSIKVKSIESLSELIDTQMKHNNNAHT